uniref:Putative inosine-uridine preferring nucleoside hydrolase n=1 Tax=Xenopsylla cheopis TaxID=163159 RepID=A0A6M2E2Z9_XENCH
MKILYCALIVCISCVSCENERGKVSEIPQVIVDVDAGSDDAIAILMLLSAHKKGEINLKAITCVAGNTKLNNVATNVLRVLEAASALNIPLYNGAAEGLVPDPDYNLDSNVYHGKDGFGDIDYGGHNPNRSYIRPEHAVNIIYNLVSENPNKIIMVFLGPLTNAALIGQMHPDFFQLVKDIFIMGGNYKGVGNKSNAAEFNFGMDPEAAYLIFKKSKRNITLLPWETCMKINLTADWRFNVMGNIDNEEMKLMNKVELSINILHNNETIYYACDSAGVAVMLNPQIIVNSFTIHTTVELYGRFTRGQTVIDHNSLYTPNTKIVTQIDDNVFKKMLMVAAGHNAASL